MTTLTKVLAGIAAILLAVAFGYYFAPEKTKTITKEVVVEKKVVEKVKETNKRKTKVVITRPDGTKEEREIEEEITRDEDRTIDSRKEKKVVIEEKTKSSSRLHIAALSSVNVRSGSFVPVYGAAVSKDVLGPINVGVFGLTDGTAGVSVGISF